MTKRRREGSKVERKREKALVTRNHSKEDFKDN